MDLNKLTIKSQQALQEAQQIAMQNEQQTIENAHLIKGIFNIDENVILSFSKNYNLTQVFLKRQ